MGYRHGTAHGGKVRPAIHPQRLQLIPRRTAKITGLFSVCFILIGAVAWLYFHLGSLLIVSDQLPAKLDVLYTLSGENTRITYAQKIYPGYLRTLRLMSCPPEMKSDSAFQRWVRRNSVITVDTCANTRSEIGYLISSLSQVQSANRKKEISVGIISNWYHMRRVQLIVNVQMKHPKWRVYYLCVPSHINPYRSGAATWWKPELISACEKTE